MKIKLYLSPENHWCKELRAWLRKKRQPVEIRDLDEETKARDELLEKSNQLAVPMLDINGEIIIGFQPDRIEAALVKAKAELKALHPKQ